MKLHLLFGFCFFFWGTQAMAQVTNKPMKPKVTTVANTNENLRSWVWRNLKIELPAKVGKVPIPQNIKYTADLTPAILNELKADMWFGSEGITKPTFEYYPSYLDVDYSLDGMFKMLLLNNHYMVVSYHLSLGSSGDMLLIDLKTMKMKQLVGYNAYKFKSEHVLYVSQDYYDKEGHAWEEGEYNILTGTYKFLSKEH